MNLLATIVLLPLLVGTTSCFWAGQRNTSGRRRLTALCAGLVTFASFAIICSLAPQIFAGGVIAERTEWVPAIGLDLGFRLDGLALLFAGLITGIGLLIVLYASYYLGKDDPAGKFFSQLMLFMAAMLGVAVSDNLLLLLVFWELTSVSSFLLIGYWGHKEESRAGARMALAVTGGGGLVMLAGFVLLGRIAGTYDLSQMVGHAAAIQADPRFPVALVLILVGCFTKSAQWPFHFWLPEAMAAPTPVSAYLHSATMVKAGIFLLARMYPVLGGSGLFEGIVTSVGLITMAYAAFVAIFRHDLKALLAYSTISHLGLIVFLIGLASPLSAVAAVFHLMNHASFKCALFMTAGIVDHETGTRDMRRLGGLARMMPWTATVALVAAAAMAGVPLTNGFVSKEMFLTEAVDAQRAFAWGAWVPIAATLGSIFSFAYSLRFVHDVFFGPAAKDLPHPHPHEPPLGMRAPATLLAAVALVVGLIPALTFGPMVQLAAGAILGAPPPEYHLSPWHGFNLPLLLSAVAIAGGIALYALLRRDGRLHRHEPRPFSGKAMFTAVVDGVFAFSGRLVGGVENGSLQRYLAWMVGAAIVLAAWPLLGGNGASPGTGSRVLWPAPPLAWAVWLLLVGCGTALVLNHRQRFRAVVLTGAVGLVASLGFAAFSAPDLALTQLSVEVVSTVLLLMGLALLPQTSPRESGVLRRGRDALLAIGGGAGVGWLCWLVLTRDHDSISWYFLANALPLGGGSNVVNVILVDFRGYDTFGEITVLGIAAVGVLALLDGLRVHRPALDPQGRPWSFAVEPLMLRIAAQLILPVALLVSIYIFWRGHNLPGGGFIAGLITAVALTLQFVALGQERTGALLHGRVDRRFTCWVGSGLAIAGLTGIGAFFLGHPFLTSASGHPTVEPFGELALASAAIFDLGVYITVVGATMLMLAVLGAASKEPPSAHPVRRQRDVEARMGGG